MTEHLEQGAVIVLDEIVRRAVRAHASDIHLEPKRDRMNVRFRVDGEMIEEQSVPLDISSEVVSRIKVLARMDIAERRVPQDGQLTLTPEGNTVHLRASSFPASLGEKIVMRILSGQALIPFEKIGLDAVTQAIVRELVDRPQGFLVTSGPTGAGKTSTLYSFMRLIDTRRTNVMTLEDPIEVELPQITQGQTNVKAGFTFATGLRAILRQDPDVVMIGEIRDFETAQIAIQASLTGHLVLATVHTNDAPSTVNRLIDMGVEPFLLSSSLLGVLAQRLVRKLCEYCKREDENHRWHPVGCEHCVNSGYKGRTGVYELLVVDETIQGLIHGRAAEHDVIKAAVANGMRSMRDDGERLVREGVTSLEEVVRVTRD